MISAPTPCARTAAVAAAFGAAAGTYDGDAGLQRLVAAELSARIAALPLPETPAILEIGCGTGFLSLELGARRPDGRWLITDLSEPMVVQCRRRLMADADAGTDAGTGPEPAFLVMDGQRPCLAPPPRGGFDLICASLALQWFADPGAALAAWAGLLRPGGRLAFATLAAGTFAEWRAAHTALGLEAGIPDYPDAGQLAALLPPEGRGRIDVETIARPYPDGHSFLRVLKRTGTHLAAPGRRPLPPGALRRVLRHFSPASGLVVTYRVAYGCFLKEDGPP